MSEKPLEEEHYHGPQLWADDVAAMISALDLDRPVLVGWSYGGFIMSDYVHAHGEGSIAGLNYVADAVMLNEIYDSLGPRFLENAGDATAPDLPTNVTGMCNFLRPAPPGP